MDMMIWRIYSDFRIISSKILLESRSKKYKYVRFLEHYMRLRNALIISIFLVILIWYPSYYVATRIVTGDTKIFEISSTQGLVLEKRIEQGLKIDQDLENFFFNDDTRVSFEKDETLLAFHYSFRSKIPKGLLEKLQSSYFEIILHNEEGWAQEFMESKPEFDFPSKKEVNEGSQGILEVCDVTYTEENDYCIFVPLENIMIEGEEHGGFWVRIHLDSIFAFEENIAEKLRINRAILILNILSYVDKTVSDLDKTKKESTLFYVFFPIQYEFSVIVGKPTLRWEPELSRVSLEYGNAWGAFQDSFVIRLDTRSYLVAIWALIASIAISISSIIIGATNSNGKYSSVRKCKLYHARIEELTEEYFRIKEEIKNIK